MFATELGLVGTFGIIVDLFFFFFFLSAVEKGYIVNREKSASGLGGLL